MSIDSAHKCTEPSCEPHSLAQAVKGAKAGSIRMLMESVSFPMCPRSLTRLIMACRNSRQWKKAVEVLDVARSGDLPLIPKPNFFAYSAVVSVCCKSRRVSESLVLLQDMRLVSEKDRSLAPDSVVYRLVISCCVREERYDEAITVFEDMLREGVEPDDKSLEHVIFALVARKKWDMVLEVLDKIHGRSKVLSILQYNQIMAACATDGVLDTAVDVFLMMQMMEVVPDASTFHHIMCAIRMGQQPGLGVGLIESIQDAPQHIYLKTYGCLFSAIVASREMWLLPRAIAALEAQNHKPQVFK